ncbi:MAG TPA: signal peptidase I [Polyangia bacterium]|nr:signal peptidase I [Polyangia bacterium]
MGALDDYRAWRSRDRGIKEARLLLREGRRVLRKYSHRLTAEQSAKVKAAIDALSEAVVARDWDKLPGALNTLDDLLDSHLGFARKSTAREYTESIAIAVLIALFLRAFVVEAFKIPSGSMIPTLQVGDHIFVNKFIYGVRIPFTNIKFGMEYRKPQRGEVIVFIYPLDHDKDFIKRIVAVEGDTVEMRQNQVYVNGKPIQRKHIDAPCRYWDFLEDAARWEERSCDAWQETVNGNSYTTYYDANNETHSSPLTTVPKDHVFVMGDNRDNSSDSRVWGFVPLDLIKGKAMVIWWSHGEPEGIRVKRMFSLVH